jgi:alpha-tubulin suppressor-like RCC1 family protein
MDNDQAGAEISARSTKAKRRKISIALAIVVVVAIGVTAVVTTSGDNKSARSGGTYTPGDPLAWTAVEGGGAHTCALVNSGQVKCWGQNTYGQLGDGTTANRTTPVFVSDISTATIISAGYYHSCAVLSDGGVKCWGQNNYGQLGNGISYAALRNAYTPVAVSGISTATSISAGRSVSCAVLTDGQVKCWGYNYYGQLGNGITGTNSNTPVAVSGISTATSIGTGFSHSCAVLQGGDTRCWGRNDFGQLGYGGIGRNWDVPQEVTDAFPELELSDGRPRNVDVSGGRSHSCAVLSGGQVTCWGDGSYGQLATGDPIVGFPRAVTNIPTTTGATATSISLGSYHSCAVLSDASIECWGYNASGQLGNGTSGIYSNSDNPVPVQSP